MSVLAMRQLSRKAAVRRRVWSAEAAGVNGKQGCHLQHRQNLLASCTRIQRAADVPACPFPIEIGARGVDRDADQLDGLTRENPVGPRIRGHVEALFGPVRVPLSELGQGSIPRAGFLLLLNDGFLMRSWFARVLISYSLPVLLAAVETSKQPGQKDCHQQSPSSENEDAGCLIEVELSHAAHEQISDGQIEGAP